MEVLGLYLSLSATFCSSAMRVWGKIAGARGIPVFQIMLGRSLIMLLLTMPFLISNRLYPWERARGRLLLLRGLLGFGNAYFMYLSVQLLPVADAAALAFLTPVLVAVFSPIILKEPSSSGVKLAVPLSLLGVIMVCQPTVIAGSVHSLNPLGVLVGIAQAILSASAKLCIRALSFTESIHMIVASMALVSLCGSLLMMCLTSATLLVIPPDTYTWAALILASLFGWANQLLAAASLQRVPAAPAVALSFTSVLWGMIADVIFFQHPPKLTSILGAIIVCSSSVLVLQKTKKGPHTNKPGAHLSAAQHV